MIRLLVQDSDEDPLDWLSSDRARPVQAPIVERGFRWPPERRGRSSMLADRDKAVDADDVFGGNFPQVTCGWIFVTSMTTSRRHRIGIARH